MNKLIILKFENILWPIENLSGHNWQKLAAPMQGPLVVMENRNWVYTDNYAILLLISDLQVLFDNALHSPEEARFMQPRSSNNKKERLRQSLTKTPRPPPPPPTHRGADR